MCAILVVPVLYQLLHRMPGDELEIEATENAVGLSLGCTLVQIKFGSHHNPIASRIGHTQVVPVASFAKTMIDISRNQVHSAGRISRN